MRWPRCERQGPPPQLWLALSRSARSCSAGEGGLFEPAKIVCHCLLVETSDSLVLIDSGFGTEDARNPRSLGIGFGLLMRPRPRLEDTALEQVKKLGFEPGDVRHIVATHLDLDHAGGLPDFPDASVHVLAREHEIAMAPPLDQRLRYVKSHWSHGPKWATHEPGGDKWFGFESVQALPGVEPEIVLVPLVGHSRGHTAVAVKEGERWLLHCGDGYFHRDEIKIPPSVPAGLNGFEVVMADSRKDLRNNQERLRELARSHGDEVDIFCAHDHHELERFA